MRMKRVWGVMAAVCGLLVASSAWASETQLDLSLSSRETLIKGLNETLNRSPLDASRVAVQVISLDTADVVFAHNADELLNPASNVKLVTTATALARLGPEFQFSTEFACSQRVVNGECPVLYIRGRGDPLLYTERIYGIAGDLMHHGLQKIGRIVVDDTYFDAVRGGPGWDQENTANSDRAYMAPAGALSVNHNTVAIYVSPGAREGLRAKIEIEPASDFFIVDNAVVTVPRRSRGRINPSSQAAGGRQRVRVTGRLPLGRRTAVFYRKVDNPPMYAGETFKAIFIQRGISVRGNVQLGVVPEGAVELHTSYSRSLGEVVRELNKHSNNFMAEQVLKTLGAEVKGPPGTWAKGVSVVEEWLAEIGIPKGSFVMQNGSGLNDTNRFSVSQLTRLLASVESRSWFFPEYAASLPVAGRDGTLRNRLDETLAAGRLRGKTGTLENVTALSGYMRLASGERLAYSIIVNDFSSRHGPAIRAVNSIAATIASGGHSVEDPGVIPPVPRVAMTSELKARAATFAQLSRVAGERNLPFLRTALREETDPVLRTVIADAMYRADASVGLWALLENIPASVEAFDKLRSVGQELSLPTPGVSSLIDVAAEGHPDALDKLLLLVSATCRKDQVEPMFAEGLQEVGRNAPDELYEALGRAPDDVDAIVLSVLGQGIAESGEQDTHPFIDRLRAPGDDGVPVAAALAIYEKIEQAFADVEEARAQAKKAEAEAKNAVPAPVRQNVLEVSGGG